MGQKISGKRRKIEHRRMLVATLFHRGYRTQREIVEQLQKQYSIDVDRSTISRDLKILERRWIKSAEVDIDVAKGEIVDEINGLKREYWLGFIRSCEEKVTTATEKVVAAGVGTGSTGGRDKASVRRENLIGDKRFLDGVQWCIEQRCKILGVEAPSRSEVTMRNWNIWVHRDRENGR